jgi:hypothetical protein
MTDQSKPPPICNDCDHAVIGDLLYWTAAINSWHERKDKSYIIGGLRLNRPIPPFARDFIADMIDGKVRGLHVSKSILNDAALARRNGFIRSAYKSLMISAKKAIKEGCITIKITPRDVAIEELADIYGLSISTIKEIVSNRI